MHRIALQDITKAQAGTVEAYWFENPVAGIKRTRFHRVTIPLEPFDSGLGYEEQPVSTEIVAEWYKLELSDPTQLDGLNLQSDNYQDSECSVYIGSAHNWWRVVELQFSFLKERMFTVTGELLVEFENEGKEVISSRQKVLGKCICVWPSILRRALKIAFTNASGESRTPTSFRTQDPESCLSTNFSTEAKVKSLPLLIEISVLASCQPKNPRYLLPNPTRFYKIP